MKIQSTNIVHQLTLSIPKNTIISTDIFIEDYFQLVSVSINEVEDSILVETL